MSAEMSLNEKVMARVESKKSHRPAISAKTKSTAMTSHYSKVGFNESSAAALQKFTNIV